MAEVAIEQKRTEWELHRVRAARTELEIKVLQKTTELDGLKNSIVEQLKREAELEQMLKGNQ